VSRILYSNINRNYTGSQYGYKLPK